MSWCSILEVSTERLFAEQDHPIEALLLDRQHPTFGDRVHVRSLVSRTDQLHAGIVQDLLELTGVLGVQIDDQIALAEQEAVDRVS